MRIVHSLHALLRLHILRVFFGVVLHVLLALHLPALQVLLLLLLVPLVKQIPLILTPRTLLPEEKTKILKMSLLPGCPDAVQSR